MDENFPESKQSLRRITRTIVNLNVRKRKVAGAVLLLVLNSFLVTRITLAQDTIFYYNPLWTTYSYVNNPTQANYLDSSIELTHRFHPVEAPFGYLHIGQMGAPETSMFLITDHDPFFDIGFHQFDLYWLRSDRLKFYDSKHPYTLVSYQQGSKSEIKGAFTHTQNIIPRLSLGVELNRLRTDGFYLRQVSRITNFDAFTRYASKSGFYHLNVGYILNSVKVEENGGITDPNIFKDTSVFDKSLVDIRLDSAFNRWKNDAVFFQNSFDFGKYENVKKNDSVTQKVVQTRVRLQHFFEWERRTYNFSDAAIDSNFYKFIYLDSLKTRDTLRYDCFSNEVRARFMSSDSGSFKNFNADIFFHHNLFNIRSHLPDEPVQDGVGGFELQKLFSGDTSRRNQVIVKLNGAYNFFDFNKGDYSLHIQAGFLALRSVSVLVEALQSKNHPSYIQQNYLSNHFEWHNAFKPSETSSLRVSFIENRWKLMVRAELFRIKNDLYWNSNALPSQYNGMLNGFAVFLGENFRVGSFHLDNELQYQHFNTDSIITFPAFFARHSFYFENKLFKGALESKIGFDVRYTNSYYGPAYMPATGQFYIQHEGILDFYPATDLYINIKVKSVRAFIELQNVTMDLLSSGYFSAYRYPMPDRGFKLGIEWRFWN